MNAIAARLTLNAVIIALIVGALVVQTVRIEGLRIWPVSITGLKAKNDQLRAELKSISDARDEQRKETDKRMGETRVIIREVEVPARQVETAPTAPNCATPPVIMGADW